MNDDLAAVCATLDAEPMFHMSLGSKELFHSNFLAWFADRFPEPAAAALAPWAEASPGAGGQRTQRELKSMDLVLDLPGLQPVAIENKVFSLPDEDQLDRYAATLPDEYAGASLLLLSLSDPEWSNDAHEKDGHPWRYLSYGQLAAALVDQAPAVATTDLFAAELLRHYCAFVRGLTQLVDLVGELGEGDEVMLPPETLALLRSVRVRDAVQKMRCRAAAHLVARELKEAGLADERVVIRSGFTNSRGLVEAFVALDNGDQLGRQLQGDAWRLAAISPSLAGRGPEAREKRSAHAGRYAEWFNFDLFYDIVGTTEAASRSTGARTPLDGFNH